MADGVEFSLIGVEELIGKLDAVTVDVKRKGGRFALRKAAQIVVAKAKQNADRINDPKTAREISKNITLRWNGRLYKRTGDIGFRIGVMGGSGGNKPTESFSGLPGLDTRHWRFVELGTSKARAQPFMRPAMENNISEITNEFMTQYSKALDRAIKKANKAKARS